MNVTIYGVLWYIDPESTLSEQLEAIDLLCWIYWRKRFEHAS